MQRMLTIDSGSGFDTHGISVIIPSYKPEAYIRECLSSLREQDLQPDQFEILVVLNGCCEPYFSDLSEFCKHGLKDNNLKLIQTDTGGVSNARNIGLDNARGEYVCFIDDDDLVSPDYLKELHRLAKKGNCVAIANSRSFSDSIGECWPNAHARIFSKFGEGTLVPVLNARTYMSVVWGKMIPRVFIADRRFDTSFKNNEDSLFMFSISDCIQRFCVANPSVIYYRRVRNQSLTHGLHLPYLLKNNARFVLALTRVYLQDARRYSFAFYVSRVLATFKNTAFFLLKSRRRNSSSSRGQ